MLGRHPTSTGSSKKLGVCHPGPLRSIPLRATVLRATHSHPPQQKQTLLPTPSCFCFRARAQKINHQAKKYAFLDGLWQNRHAHAAPNKTCKEEAWLCGAECAPDLLFFSPLSRAAIFRLISRAAFLLLSSDSSFVAWAKESCPSNSLPTVSTFSPNASSLFAPLLLLLLPSLFHHLYPPNPAAAKAATAISIRISKSQNVTAPSIPSASA